MKDTTKATIIMGDFNAKFREKIEETEEKLDNDG